jgi:hypothetical protein
MLMRKPRNVRLLSPLLGGEGQGEGGRKNKTNLTFGQRFPSGGQLTGDTHIKKCKAAGHHHF